METRIREVNYGTYSRFYTEREWRGFWIPALHCHFNTLKEAQDGLDFYILSHAPSDEPVEIYHKYP
ncbi:hypothetical protein D3C85_293180 [compost metagenome]